jgi:CelD/BcsL family acetyltransferase involved in cellulose biosynthesis
MELRVQLFREREQIPLTAGEWRALVSANETNTVFQTFEWFDAWWRTFGDDHHRLYFLLVTSADRPIGFAALMTTRLSSGLDRLEFVGTGNADYQDFVLPEHKREAIAAICSFLHSNSSAWQRAWLCNIPETSSTLGFLREEGKRHGLFLVEELRVPCPSLRLEGADSAVSRLLSKYSLRRPVNWFSRLGEVVFRHVSELKEIESLLPQFFDQHVRRWAAVGRPSVFQDERQRRFFCTLAQNAHGTGWLQFSMLQAAGEPIAFHFGFDYGGSVTWYKPSFEVKYAEHSPGLLLIRRLIEDALGRRRSELDFTIGGEPFKQRFANSQRTNIYVGLYHSRSAQLLSVTVRRTRGLAGKVLRSVQGAVRGLPKVLTAVRR